MAAAAFGILFRKLREDKGQSLREFCQKNGYDPGNISKLERGIMSPPQSEEKLTEYALALGLEPGSAEMQQFIDTGLTCAGQIPPDIMANEHLVAHLPTLLRTVSSGMSTEQLDSLMAMIKKN